MSDPFFFGYGSLVNRATHFYHDAHRARLSGWRRAWRHVEPRAVTLLTAVPAPADQVIDGLVAHVPNDDWVALDKREGSYERTPVTESVIHNVGRPVHVQVYSIPQGRQVVADLLHPVPLSYVDVVVQGFLREFGEDGVARFFDTTDGWTAPIRDDRADPIYPRHQTLDGAERRLVDTHLDRVGAQVV